MHAEKRVGFSNNLSLRLCYNALSEHLRREYSTLYERLFSRVKPTKEETRSVCDFMVGKPETVLNACLPCRKEAIADIVIGCRFFEVRHDIRRDL